MAIVPTVRCHQLTARSIKDRLIRVGEHGSSTSMIPMGIRCGLHKCERVDPVANRPITGRRRGSHPMRKPTR
jgi:hypothetical protein